jgi:hypothetical protein
MRHHRSFDFADNHKEGVLSSGLLLISSENHHHPTSIMATAPPFNPIVANGGFELGVLAPWIPSDVNAATIQNAIQLPPGRC